MKKKRARQIRTFVLVLLAVAGAAALAFVFHTAHMQRKTAVTPSSLSPARPASDSRVPGASYRPTFVPYSPYQAREPLPYEAPPQVAPGFPPAPPLPPAQPYSGKPRIAIVLDDMGLNVSGTMRAIALPSSVTLSFLPYGSEAARLSSRAKEAGHEILLHVPMEPLGRENPGPGALLVDQTAGENLARLDWALSRFGGYDGVNNHMGSRFTSAYDHISRIMGPLRERGLFFLDSATSLKSVGAKAAREAGVPTETRDVFLDTTPTLVAVKAQLATTELIAKRKGYAIAIGHPHPATLEALESWARHVESRGFTLVPVRDLMK